MLEIRHATARPATPQEAVAAARALHGEGVAVSLERRPDAGSGVGAAAATVEQLRAVLADVAALPAPRAPELVLHLPSLVTPLATDVLPAGHARSDAVLLDRARQVCRAARNAGVGITVDTDDRLPVDRALGILRDLRKDFPETAVTVHAGLLRAEADCRGLAHEGSRVRLVPGGLRRAGRPGTADTARAAYRSRLDADRSFVRCLGVLLAGQGAPVVATDDPALLRIAQALAARHARATGSYELQVTHGARALWRGLHEDGEAVRVRVRWGEAARPPAPRAAAAARRLDRALDRVLDRALDRALDRVAEAPAGLAGLGERVRALGARSGRPDAPPAPDHRSRRTRSSP